MNVLAPKFQDRTLTKNQSVSDIVKGIGVAVKESRPTADILKKKFKDPDPVISCQKVWDFLKDPDNIEYIRESGRSQTVKTINRILWDKLGDCKHYATFSQSILTALGIPNFIRLVSQDKKNKEATHIYTEASIDGKLYTVDPCMSRFDKECKYYYKCDLIQKDMALKFLNGVDDVAVGRTKLKDRLKKTERQIKNEFNAAKKKQDDLLKKAGKEIKNFPKKFAVINNARAKKAFLKYISINGGGFATRIKQEYNKDPNAVKLFWSKFGTWDEFKNAVNAGSKQGAKISGDDGTDTGDSSGGSSGGSSGQAATYEAGAKESVGIIKQLIAWFKARKAKKNGDDQIVEKMETAIDQDPNIPKIDDTGTTIPPPPAHVGPPLISVPNVGPAPVLVSRPSAAQNTDDSNNAAASFGLSEINSIDSFIHWLRGCMSLCLGLSIIGHPAIGSIVAVGSFVYLTRKKIYNAYKTAVTRRAEKRSTSK